MLADLAGVEVVQGDLARPESLVAVLEGIDTALLCSSIGPQLPELQANFVRAAKSVGVRYVVKFSGMDAHIHSEWRFLRWHGEAERKSPMWMCPWRRRKRRSWTEVHPNGL